MLACGAKLVVQLAVGKWVAATVGVEWVPVILGEGAVRGNGGESEESLGWELAKRMLLKWELALIDPFRWCVDC
jgi:hypothetical protein